MKRKLFLRRSPRATSVVLAANRAPAKPVFSMGVRLAAAVSMAFALTQGAHALNPQPLPPRDASMVSLASRVALNPQPLPPRDATIFGQASRVALNPQPLPPRQVTVLSPASRVALNPQPLPPRVVIPSAIRFGFGR